MKMVNSRTIGFSVQLTSGYTAASTSWLSIYHTFNVVKNLLQTSVMYKGAFMVGMKVFCYSVLATPPTDVVTYTSKCRYAKLCDCIGACPGAHACTCAHCGAKWPQNMHTRVASVYSNFCLSAYAEMWSYLHIQWDSPWCCTFSGNDNVNMYTIEVAKVYDFTNKGFPSRIYTLVACISGTFIFCKSRKTWICPQSYVQLQLQQEISPWFHHFIPCCRVREHSKSVDLALSM